MEAQERQITKVEDAVKIASDRHKDFELWRGHSACFDNLKPKLLRPTLKDQYVNVSEVKRIEDQLFQHFYRRGSLVTRELPKFDDKEKWICLLQHYGMPTRLLDWTYNILNALYFVVWDVDKDEVNGELFGLNPDILNSYLFGGIFPKHDDPYYQYYLWESNYNNERELLRKIGQDSDNFSPPTHPIAIYPPVYFERMGYQNSFFTIHPLNLRNKIEEEFRRPQSDDQEFPVKKYIVPSDSKKNIRDQLESIGLSKGMMFNSLDLVSEDIIGGFNKYSF